MEAPSRPVPHLPLVITEEDLNGGAVEVLRAIRPHWNVEELEFKLLTDGITNKLVGCKPKDEDDAETVLVRVYGNKTDLLIDRKAETRNIQLLSSLGLAPSLYATFLNGLAYQFVPGCTLNEDTVVLPHIYRLVAKKMAKLHKVRVPGCGSKPEPFLWDKIQRFLALVPDVFSDSKKHQRYLETVTPKSKIKKEIDYMQGVLEDLDSPVVFAHNDLLLGNVIFTEDKNCVTFIDYEYAGLNYQAFDIGINEIDFSRFPSKDFQLDWIKLYLEEYQNSFTENDVMKLYVQVNKFVLISHLFWACWALIQTEHSYIDFDFLGYATIRLNQYFATKDQILALEFPV